MISTLRNVIFTIHVIIDSDYTSHVSLVYNDGAMCAFYCCSVTAAAVVICNVTIDAEQNEYDDVLEGAVRVTECV